MVMKTLNSLLRLAIIIFLNNSTILAQLDLSVYSDKETYEYGETIKLYAKVTNTADTTFEFLAGNYETCQAEFSFNDFNSWDYATCLPTAQMLTFKPHSSKIYSWRIEPQSLGLPNKDGSQTIIGTYYFDLADTIFIQAPRFIGGEIRLTFHEDYLDSIYSLGQQLNVNVVHGDHFGEIKSEVWQIEGFDIDSLINIYSSDSIFVSFEKSIWIMYEDIVDENPLDYYPLQIGNKWFYNESGIAYEVEPIIINKTYTEEITKDSIDNNGQKYFYLQSDFGNYWLRMDSTTGNIYKKYSFEDLEFLSYNLAYQPDDEIETENGIIYNVIEQDSILWEDLRNIKTHQLYSLYTHQITFAEDIGIINKLNSFDFGNTEVKLLGCLIDGKMYGDTTVVGIKDNRNETPTQFSLSQNYPNPFNPTTTIEYTIPINEKRESKNVKIVVYDLLGKVVETLIDQKQPHGKYLIVFDASNLTSGIYYYSLLIDNNIQTRKMILLK